MSHACRGSRGGRSLSVFLTAVQPAAGRLGPFPENNGLRPLKTGKNLLRCIHRSTLTAYDQWRDNPAAYAAGAACRYACLCTRSLIGELRLGR